MGPVTFDSGRSFATGLYRFCSFSDVWRLRTKGTPVLRVSPGGARVPGAVREGAVAGTAPRPWSELIMTMDLSSKPAPTSGEKGFQRR
jgi:hypothetical protein